MSEPPIKPARRRAPSTFRQTDVARTIAAAQGRGLDIVRVEVEPKTAKITLVVRGDDNTESKSDVNPFDDAPVPEPTRRGRKKKSCA
jgi:hypothetical protein